MLKQRVITASILAPLALAVVFLLPLYWFKLVIAAVVILGAWEWSNFITHRKSIRWAYIALVAVFILILQLNFENLMVPVLLLSTFFWMFALIVVRRYPQVAFIHAHLSKALIGLLVLLPVWISMVGLRASDQGELLIAVLFALVWGADIGAYFSGKRFGTHKLMPAVSPGKTVEGLVGGVAVCLLIALGVSVVLEFDYSATAALVLLAIVTGLISVLGDLFESLFKRESGVKDSGTILPGHGGILDRIDSLTAAAPIFFLGVRLTQIF